MSSVIIQKGLENVIVAETKLSYIDGDKGILYYSGYPIEVLAERSTFEEVAYLLWYGRLPSRKELEEFKKNLRNNRSVPPEVIAIMRLLPKTANSMDVLKTAVAALGPYDPELEDNSVEANIRKAIRIQAKIATIVAAIYRIKEGLELINPNPDYDEAANFLYMMFGREPDPLAAKIMDVAFILHAEHEFPCSTMAGVTTISSLSDLYSAVVSAIGALKGPLHGGANERALEMIMEIGDPEKAEEWVLKAIKEKRRIMGFGHRVYKAYDPRARIFLEYLRRLSDERKDWNFLRISEVVEKTMIRELGAKGIFPNIDFYSGQVYHMLGIPKYLFTPIFALARTAGWTAHFIEYVADNRLVRPRAHYTGPIGLEYVPIDQR